MKASARGSGVLFLFMVCIFACASEGKRELPTLEVVHYVNLGRYAGTWYEIARFPHRFQEGCRETTATYTLRDDGKIDVLNQCRTGPHEGEQKSAKGKAWVVDTATNAKLKVSFFWPFAGHYWIIDLGKEYEYAVVGHPDRTYLWILSRTPDMAPDLYARIIQTLKKQSYDTDKLLITAQEKMSE
jgi:apolipoprotein D and lipocalin family protein